MSSSLILSAGGERPQLRLHHPPQPRCSKLGILGRIPYASHCVNNPRSHTNTGYQGYIAFDSCYPTDHSLNHDSTVETFQVPQAGFFAALRVITALRVWSYWVMIFTLAEPNGVLASEIALLSVCFCG